MDFYSLTVIPPEEAVARIKDKPTVTLTVVRGLVPPTAHKQNSAYSDHIYDEILYADQEKLSHHDDGALLKESGHRHRLGANSSPSTRRKGSPLGFQHQHQPVGANQNTLPVEKGSKDSGLSSGSSTSPDHKHRVTRCEESEVYAEDARFGKPVSVWKSYKTERENLQNFLKTKKQNSEQLEAEETESRRRKTCRIEGEYEVEVCTYI